MRTAMLVGLLIPAGVWAQQMSIGSVAQTGTCTVAGVTGNVTINCPGVNPSILKILNQQFNARLKDRDARIDQITKEANEWKDRFLDLSTRLADAGVNDGLQRKADELLKAGELDEAGKVLDGVIAGEEKKVNELAENQFNRASLYELEFKPLQALPLYEKAYRYRPNNSRYGEAYANLLYSERDFGKAEAIYKCVLEIRRELAKGNSAACLPYVAVTLNNLGALYSETQRLKEAEDAYTEALQIRRELAKKNPAAYRPDVAATLSNLGALYSETQRLKEAEDAYTEALQIRRELAKKNPAAYRPDVARTLSGLGLLYILENRSVEAAPVCNEAAAIFKQLLVDNSAEYGAQLSSLCITIIGEAPRNSGR
jgi:tetratricopeptide (TPR) repeat protein